MKPTHSYPVLCTQNNYWLNNSALSTLYNVPKTLTASENHSKSVRQGPTPLHPIFHARNLGHREVRQLVAESMQPGKV